GAPEQLESALVKISGTIQRIPKRDLRDAEPLSALFFASPRREVFMEVFSDHPSVEKRLARLQRLSQEIARG
ncbi:MAG: zinc metalloprotease HtpX, partial [Chloroflexota bacterium]|nr:zinc metalloprotease HtpX [Chloroflexota bacterium]